MATVVVARALRILRVSAGSAGLSCGCHLQLRMCLRGWIVVGQSCSTHVRHAFPRVSSVRTPVLTGTPSEAYKTGAWECA